MKLDPQSPLLPKHLCSFQVIYLRRLKLKVEYILYKVIIYTMHYSRIDPLKSHHNLSAHPLGSKEQSLKTMALPQDVFL